MAQQTCLTVWSADSESTLKYLAGQEGAKLTGTRTH